MAPPPKPPKVSAGWETELPDPETALPPLQIFGYAPDTKHALLILPSLKILQ